MKSKMQKTEVNSHHEHVQGFRLRILISVVLKEKVPMRSDHWRLRLNPQKDGVDMLDAAA